ncbi:hypothetical protein ADUPG1_000620, partial [Aduncisulcus paluster]
LTALALMREQERRECQKREEKEHKKEESTEYCTSSPLLPVSLPQKPSPDQLKEIDDEKQRRDPMLHENSISLFDYYTLKQYEVPIATSVHSSTLKYLEKEKEKDEEEYAKNPCVSGPTQSSSTAPDLSLPSLFSLSLSQASTHAHILMLSSLCETVTLRNILFKNKRFRSFFTTDRMHCPTTIPTLFSILLRCRSLFYRSFSMFKADVSRMCNGARYNAKNVQGGIVALSWELEERMINGFMTLLDNNRSVFKQVHELISSAKSSVDTKLEAREKKDLKEKADSESKKKKMIVFSDLKDEEEREEMSFGDKDRLSTVSVFKQVHELISSAKSSVDTKLEAREKKDLKEKADSESKKKKMSVFSDLKDEEEREEMSFGDKDRLSTVSVIVASSQTSDVLAEGDKISREMDIARPMDTFKDEEEEKEGDSGSASAKRRHLPDSLGTEQTGCKETMTESDIIRRIKAFEENEKVRIAQMREQVEQIQCELDRTKDKESDKKADSSKDKHTGPSGGLMEHVEGNGTDVAHHPSEHTVEVAADGTDSQGGVLHPSLPTNILGTSHSLSVKVSYDGQVIGDDLFRSSNNEVKSQTESQHSHISHQEQGEEEKIISGDETAISTNHPKQRMANARYKSGQQKSREEEIEFIPTIDHKDESEDDVGLFKQVDSSTPKVQKMKESFPKQHILSKARFETDEDSLEDLFAK